MKIFIVLSILTNICLGQNNSDGRIKAFHRNGDFNGDGIVNSLDVNSKTFLTRLPGSKNNSTQSYSQFWSSPTGAFGNCWDGIVGYFDNDTLLDVAGYTFSPNKFYIWEQSPTKPDSFYVVYEYIKTEFGGFGPIAAGDLDGDGTIDLVLADYSTLSRLYIFSCTGNNSYLSRETQNIITHPNENATVQSLLIGDLNKNGQKEIICQRYIINPPGGTLRIWEHTGGIGSFNFNNLYNYSTVTILSGKSGIGDSDGDGWDEVFLSYSASNNFNTYLRKIEYDSVSSSFQHQIFTSTAIGVPSSYKVSDVDHNGVNELISTNNSNGVSACYIFRSTGQNQYITVDSIFENSDALMTSSDTKILTGDIYPSILLSNRNRIFVYKYNGTNYIKEYENGNYPGNTISRVYWLPWTGYDGFFNTWSSSSSNGTFYIFKRDMPNGISGNSNVPNDFILNQNYPNPFNPETNISFSLPIQNLTTLKVYDMAGDEIVILINTSLPAGNYSFNFNLSNFSSGAYFYKLTSGDYSASKKLVIIK